MSALRQRLYRAWFASAPRCNTAFHEGVQAGLRQELECIPAAAPHVGRHSWQAGVRCGQQLVLAHLQALTAKCRDVAAFAETGVSA